MYPQVRGFQKYGGNVSEKKSLEQRSQKLGASKNMGGLFPRENNLEQRSHKLGASRNPGPFFVAKRKMLAEDLMSRDIMSSEPRHWMVFGQLVMPVQCYAEATEIIM